MRERLPKKPKVSLGNLAGPEGNAFVILGRCEKAARDAGWDKEQIAAFNKAATSGSYANLLATAERMFDVRYARPRR